MNTIRRIIWSVFVAWTLCSCIDDEGNYEYSELKTVSINNVYSNWATPLGEEYVITPNIDYGEADESEFDHYWVAYLQDNEWGDTICRAKNLNYRFTRIGWYMTSLVVTHRETGTMTTKQIDIYTVPRYQQGWIILSEKEGKSVLSYVRKENSTIDGIIYPYRAYPDIYTQMNGTSDELGSEPIALGRHFSDSEDQILVIQRGGDGAVEISGTTFAKVIRTQEEFVDSEYPAGFEPIQVEYGSRLEAILSSDGKMYTRINPNGGLQVCRYSKIPLGGMNIQKMYYTNSLGFIYLYDVQENRIVAMQDEPQLYTGKVAYAKMDPEGNNAVDFTPLDNLGADAKLLYVGTYRNGSTRYFVQILKKANQYKFQKFTLDFPSGASTMYVQNGIEQLFIGSDLVNDQSQYCVINGSYLYFSAGNKLYYWDMVQNEIKEYYSFSGNITVIEHNPKDYYSGITELGIGTENGDFYILDITYDALVGAKEKVLLPMKNLGCVKDVNYKFGDYWTFTDQQ